MTGKTVRYLKENAGRWFYRRRVPDRHHKTLGFTMWNRPCGDVSWGKAVSMISTWSEEDDRLIKSLDNPQVSIPVRQATEARKMTRTLDTAEAAIQAIIGSSINRSSIDVVDQIDLPRAAKLAIQRVDQNTLFDDQDRLIRYRTILSELFGAHARVPTDPDERDDFEHAKRKLERRIAELGGDRNTITAVAERFFEFAQIKPGVRVKYRHRIAKLVAMVGDVPVVHLTASQLRQFRDEQSKAMKVSSVKAMFTPIKGLLSFALEEELIDLNPIGSVKFKREKRSKNEIKWKPYSPEQVQRLFQAMDQFWQQPLRNMPDDRRKAIWWAVRVQAYTAMRPKEVVHLEPQDVNDRWIHVRNSKTTASDRYIPLHPEISDFPAFLHAGGFRCLQTDIADRVQSVSRNFRRLTHDFMDPPMDDPKQVLYSLRSTFSNAMRRAGADETMRRSILGHSTPGALSSYDDGPEFDQKRKWVRASDPLRVYLNPGIDDGLGSDDED